MQSSTQDEPAFCGLASLAMVLNALAVDPRRAWKGAWRWFHEALLDCCRPLEDIKRDGINLDQVRLHSHTMACSTHGHCAGFIPCVVGWHGSQRLDDCSAKPCWICCWPLEATKQAGNNLDQVSRRPALESYDSHNMLPPRLRLFWQCFGGLGVVW